MFEENSDSGKIVSKSVLNTPVAADCTTANGLIRIKGCQTIIQKNFKSVTKKTAVAEVAQIIEVTWPTLVASTVYGVRTKGFGATSSSRRRVFGTRNFATPANLVAAGGAADKYNLSVGIGKKIMYAEPESVAAAGPTVTLTKAASTWIVGEKIVGATSGAVGYVVTQASTSSRVIVKSGTFVAENVVTSTSGLTTAVSAVTQVGNLGIIDKTGYWAAKHKGSRMGRTAVIPSNLLITQSSIAATVAATFSVGDGTRLYDEIMVQSIWDDNLQSGQVGFASAGGSDIPIPGETYNIYIVTEEVKATTSSTNSPSGTITRFHHVYAKDDAASIAAFDTAITTLAAA